MRNRITELCLLNHIDTASQYANLIGVSTERAYQILLCRVVLTPEEIERSCEVFNCDLAYLLDLE